MLRTLNEDGARKKRRARRPPPGLFFIGEELVPEGFPIPYVDGGSVISGTARRQSVRGRAAQLRCLIHRPVVSTDDSLAACRGSFTPRTSVERPPSRYLRGNIFFFFASN